VCACIRVVRVCMSLSKEERPSKISRDHSTLGPHIGVAAAGADIGWNGRRKRIQKGTRESLIKGVTGMWLTQPPPMEAFPPTIEILMEVPLRKTVGYRRSTVVDKAAHGTLQYFCRILFLLPTRFPTDIFSFPFTRVAHPTCTPQLHLNF
jgi:hypothetical protein